MARSNAEKSFFPEFLVRTSAESTDTELSAVFQDSSRKSVIPKSGYGALVEKLRKSETFGGRLGQPLFVRFGGKGPAENVLLIGIGSAAELTEEKLRQAGGHAWHKLAAERARSAVIQCDSFFEAQGLRSELTHLRMMRAFAEGLSFPVYQFRKYRSKGDIRENYHGPSKIVFVTREQGLRQSLEKELIKVRAAAEAMNITRDWSNEPSNHGTPIYYANEARRLAKAYGLKCKILTEADAAREKMGLFLGVGQGAEREGRIVVLEYNPKGVKNPKTIAFVGKGITFDSRGISIKPSARMEEMKHDMTGAATLFGAILLCAKLQVPNRVVCVLAFAENMPDGNAIQPGNVITSRNGKTVEVINTDAEGRLILADVLDYAQDYYKPDAVIDAATLTGAVMVALGKLCCGIMGTEESLIDAIRRAGDANGERIWPLPLWDEYFEDMKSDTADMRNSCNDSYGGAIRGGIFLKQFIRKGQAWAHLDIAGTAYHVSHLSYYPKRGANGSYVRTLAQFAAEY